MHWDVLLIQSSLSDLNDSITTLNLLPLAKRDISVGTSTQATYATIVFLGDRFFLKIQQFLNLSDHQY